MPDIPVPEERVDAAVHEYGTGEGDIREGMIEGVNFFVRRVKFEAINGRAIFEGDIDLGSVEELEQRLELWAEVGPAGHEFAVVITSNRFRWLDCLVPYDWDPALPRGTRNTIENAMEHWQERTPMRFVLRTDDNAHLYPDWVRFQPGNECSSKVGRRGGMQPITLDEDCGFGTAVHEIGHAVGLWHEQSREDRNQFVEILFQNIQPDMAFNFEQHITDGDDVGPYDYGSIMHYGRTAFSRNGQDTIRPRQGGADIGQRNGLSRGDTAAIRAMYRGQFGVEGDDRWVTSYDLHRTERMYAFYRRDRQLVVHFWDGVDQWRWARQGTPGPGVSIVSDPDVISSWQFYRFEERQLHAFVRAADGSLYENGWSDSGVHPLGRGWYWRRLGTPPGKSLQNCTPGAISFRADSAGELFPVYDRIEVFTPDSDGGFHRCSWDGVRERWSWVDQQAPGFVNTARRPRAVAFRFGGYKRVYCFMPSFGGNLWVNFSSNSWYSGTWDWADLGRPAQNVRVNSSVTAATYRYNGTDRIYCFVTGTDGKLHICFWDGNAWVWADQGTPAPGVTARATPAVVVHSYLDRKELHVFVRGSDGDLYHHGWDGQRWIWESLGRPNAQVGISGEPAVLPYTHRHIDRMYVYCLGSDDNLYICYLDDQARWTWSNQGRP